MKILLFAAVTLSVAVPCFAQDSPQLKARMDTAADWLHRLCVIPDSDFQVATPEMLNDAFDSWTKSKEDVEGCDPKQSLNSDPPLRVDASSLRLNTWERLARVPQFRTQIQQAPDYVYGLLQGSPANTPNQFFANPDHILSSYGGPVHFDELYVPADTRLAICTILDDQYDALSKKDPKEKVALDDHCITSAYLLATRKLDRFTRIGAAVTLDINFSQVPRFQAPILVTSLSDLNFPTYSKTITGSFDPSKLFRSAAEMKAIGTYVGKVDLKAKYNVDYMGRNTILRDICDRTTDQLGEADNTAHCVQAMTIGKMTQRLAISILPRIDVKAISPFDLSKFNTSFVAPPNHAGRSLYTVTFNWDLRNLVPTTKDRLAAFDAVKALHDRPKKDDKQVKDALWKRQVACLYLELKRMPEQAMNPQWWAQFEKVVLRVESRSSVPQEGKG